MCGMRAATIVSNTAAGDGDALSDRARRRLKKKKKKKKKKKRE
jgi:thiamine pyrophosphokinase